MSFPTKKAKKQHDNEYMHLLQLQLKNINTYTKHNEHVADQLKEHGEIKDSDQKDNRTLDQQLADKKTQRDNAYKNASKLFNKDSHRIDSLLKKLGEDNYPLFNMFFPKIRSTFKDYAFLNSQQVYIAFERLAQKDVLTGGVDIPHQASYVDGKDWNPVTTGSGFKSIQQEYLDLVAKKNK